MKDLQRFSGHSIKNISCAETRILCRSGRPLRTLTTSLVNFSFATGLRSVKW